MTIIYAEVVDGVVVALVSTPNNPDIQTNGVWIKSSDVNGNPTAGNPASIGYLYNGTAFYTPKPFPSWYLNTTTWQWDAPVGIPTSGGPYEWDEASQSWLTELQVAKALQSQLLSAACQNAILAGYKTTLNGQSVTFTLSDTDQTNCLMAATVAQSAVASAGVWAANSAYQFGQFVLADENYYICMVAGTSGATAPSFPEAFQSPVTDGTAVWALLGALIGTTTGNIWLTVQEIFSIYAQGVNFVTTQRAKNMALQAKIQSAATVAEVLAISW